MARDACMTCPGESCECFELEGRVHRYLRLRDNEANPVAGSVLLRRMLTRSPCSLKCDRPQPEDRQTWLADGLEDRMRRWWP